MRYEKSRVWRRGNCAPTQYQYHRSEQNGPMLTLTSSLLAFVHHHCSQRDIVGERARRKGGKKEREGTRASYVDGRMDKKERKKEKILRRVELSENGIKMRCRVSESGGEDRERGEDERNDNCTEQSRRRRREEVDPKERFGIYGERAFRFKSRMKSPWQDMQLHCMSKSTSMSMSMSMCITSVVLVLVLVHVPTPRLSNDRRMRT